MSLDRATQQLETADFLLDEALRRREAAYAGERPEATAAATLIAAAAILLQDAEWEAVTVPRLRDTT